MTEFNYSIADDYKEMDKEWWALVTPTEEELASGSLRQTLSAWDLSAHELWPRIQAEQWRVLLPSVDRAVIGKRMDTVKVFIGPKTNWSMKYGEFKWSIVTSGEGDLQNREVESDVKIRGLYPEYNLDRSYATAERHAVNPYSAYYVKVADSLGLALDVVKYRDLEGFAPITPGRLDLDTGPNQHADVYMQMIP